MRESIETRSEIDPCETAPTGGRSDSKIAAGTEIIWGERRGEDDDDLPPMRDTRRCSEPAAVSY